MTKGLKNDTQARVEESGASRKKRGRKKGSYIKPPHGLHTPRCIAVASGIPEHTVRYYLKKLAMEPVIENGRAYYTDTQSRKLIATAQEKKQKVAAAHADPGLSKRGFGVIPSNLKQMSLYQIAALMGKSRTTVWRWARSLPNQLELLSKNQRSVQGETTSFHGEQTVHGEKQIDAAERSGCSPRVLQDGEQGQADHGLWYRQDLHFVEDRRA